MKVDICSDALYHCNIYHVIFLFSLETYDVLCTHKDKVSFVHMFEDEH